MGPVFFFFYLFSGLQNFWKSLDTEEEIKIKIKDQKPFELV